MPADWNPAKQHPAMGPMQVSPRHNRNNGKTKVPRTTPARMYLTYVHSPDSFTYFIDASRLFLISPAVLLRSEYFFSIWLLPSLIMSFD